MAVTRLWQSGVESGSEDEFDNVFNVTVDSVTVKTGVYSAQIATNANGRGTVSVPNTRQLQASCFFNNNNYARDSQVWLISFRDASNNIVAGVRQNPTNLYLYANGVEAMQIY
jgi:hypothetical protein